MTDQDITKYTGDKAADDQAGEGQAPPIGAVISERWELVDHIGEGGMSDVYKARHLIMHKFGAVKFLKGNLAKDPVAVKRFQGEAMAAGNLSHRNIVQVYDCGLCEYGVYLIMEILPGVSLTEVMEARADDAPDGLGILQMAEALPIFLQICDGLEHAHKRGLVHRDIKPSNIMLIEPDVKQSDDPEEVLVKVVDFGLAKMVGLDGTTSDGFLTRAGEVFGSPVYMSPEHCMGQNLDGRSDIYSLGCLMYECMTGRRVLVGLTSTQTMMRHIEEEADIRGLLEMKDPLAKRFAEIIQNCLKRDPNERYNDVGELKAALLSLDKGANHGRAVTAKPRRLKPLAYGLMAGAALMAVSVAVALYSVWPVAAIASFDSTPINMPLKSQERKKTSLTSMSPRLYNGGEGLVARLQLSPERKLSNCTAVLKSAEQDLADKHYDDASLAFEFVFDLISESKENFPGFNDLLLRSMVGRTVATSEMKDLDGLDIGLGNVIKKHKEYFNASDPAKRYALQWRARVQKDNGSYAAAATTIEQMLALYIDDAGSQNGQNGHGSSDNSDEMTQKALWTGLLADLLRLTGDKDNPSSAMFDDYAKSLAALQSNQISDTTFAEEVLTFKARLYYRYGLALAQSHKFPEAYQAFQSSLATFARQGGLKSRLIPEVDAARVQSYLTLKHFDWWGSLQYRLQNHL
jgi:serine/threonine protein kinase